MTEYFCKFAGLIRPEAGKGSPAGNPYAVGVKVPHAAHPVRHTTPDPNAVGARHRHARPGPPEGSFSFHPPPPDPRHPQSIRPQPQPAIPTPVPGPPEGSFSFHPLSPDPRHPRSIRPQPQPRPQRRRGLPQASPSLAARRASFPHRPSAAAKNHPAHCAGWLFALWFCSRGGVCNPSGETVTLFSGQPLPGVQAGILLPVWLPPWPLWTGRCR